MSADLNVAGDSTHYNITKTANVYTGNTVAGAYTLSESIVIGLPMDIASRGTFTATGGTPVDLARACSPPAALYSKKLPAFECEGSFARTDVAKNADVASRTVLQVTMKGSPKGVSATAKGEALIVSGAADALGAGIVNQTTTEITGTKTETAKAVPALKSTQFGIVPLKLSLGVKGTVNVGGQT